MEIVVGQPWPNKDDKLRLESYKHYDQLYFGDHYSAFAIKTRQKNKYGFADQYAKLRYVVANFPGLISRVIADMLFGEPLVVDVKDANTQAWVDGLIDDTHLLAQLYESSLANSRRGDSIFKIRGTDLGTSNAKIHVEEVTPAYYFPSISSASARGQVDQELLAWTWTSEDGKTTYLQEEIHEPGKITTKLFEYDPNSEKVVQQYTDQEMKKLIAVDPIFETNIKHNLIFHVPNVRDGSQYFGTSDYKDLETLFYALNNRITKVDNILDKHSDPILAVPPGVLDENGSVNKSSLGMFEVRNDNPGFNKPEYIVWNANLESAFQEVEKMVDFLFMFSEVSPATMGMDKTGQAESGRALKFKLLRTIAKRNRKKIYYDIMIKEMLETAQEFGQAWNIKIDGKTVTTVQKPDIKWGDGVIPDYTEEIDNEIKRLDAGLSSKADAISRIDNLKPEEAKKKAEEIEKADSVEVPPIGTTKGQQDNTKPVQVVQPVTAGK